MKNGLRHLTLVSATAALACATGFGLGSIPAADAAVLLIFGQTTTADTVTGTRSGASTTITSDSTVEITAINATVVTPFSATFTLTATNTGPASLVGTGPGITQDYSGTFSITNGPINYLSGTFSDAVFGSGGALTLSASSVSPGESVSFTSNVIASNLITAFDRSASLSFTDVSPPLSIVNHTLRGFSSDVSGDFSATVPEPSTWAMMGIGFAFLGFAGFRSRKASVSIV
jgi:PEP-CTERM motif-containing protein